MEPVQLKLYGLFRRTRERYLSQQLLAVVLALGLLMVWAALPRLDEGLETGSQVSPEVHRLIWMMNQLPWVVAVLLALIALETVIVLRLFARKEQALRVANASPPPEKAQQPSAVPEQPSSADEHGTDPR